ncbi:MAG TPA: TetR/AcrR family transcriptional regulator [Bacillota bacterium]|jgi:TetR/AcrR family fatty acid metabolism transcriptional regulator|nr:TetR/AcrR family transcriptional regulator [Bacillota bacterium]HOB86387.1 TetR/AcrR family transcriptional regulator [Bacillota bacterium]HOP69392.1 TetR/AcrR family transcriptional regulator [Bacillota bacterium]HPT33201.1 TetR/AcrR family transcriptional regulator [Bacillota bacterium]HPZ64392.1 TetR/AcrR family transcriptional regulator [Bacillota bacterium]
MAKRTGEKYLSILLAAIKIFARYGYHRTRVSDIAREAGVADGTVYIYFNSKEDILISLFQEMMEQFVQGLQTELDACGNAEEKLKKLIHYHLETLEKQPDQAKVTQLELRQIDQSINEGISRPLMDYFQMIEEVIKEGQDTGFFRPEINVRTARKVIFGAIDEVVTSWVMSKKPYSLSNLSEPVFSLLSRGFLI